MADLIYRDKLLTAYDAAHKGPPGGARKLIAEAPAVDAVPVVHGKWERDYLVSTSGGAYEMIRCSECEWTYPIFETAYCPCCGARMDGEKDG